MTTLIIIGSIILWLGCGLLAARLYAKQYNGIDIGLLLVCLIGGTVALVGFLVGMLVMVDPVNKVWRNK
jgi:hypothetical protein